MNFSTRFIRVLKVVYALSGLSEGMRGSTPYSYCACEPPAPRLSFSCVKKKDGGERKSLMVPFRRGEAHSLPRGNPCVAAGFGPLQEKQNLLTPAAPQVRPLVAAAARSAFYQPRLAPASPHAPKSRATNSPGAPLHKENKETKGDALPLPVSPA